MREVIGSNRNNNMAEKQPKPPVVPKSEENVYYGSDRLANWYLKAAQQLGVEGSVTVLPEKPEWAEKKVRIELDDKARANFFKKVCEIQDQEGY